MKGFWGKVKKEILLDIPSNRAVTWLVGAIILLAVYVRIWRTDKILGFYYDQGRDALIIWDFIHNGKLFLIGPTTGIEGIFRGPWYYWLITPFYWLGRGNPVWPAVFLALTTVAAIFILYRLAYFVAGKYAAFVALIISSFSFFFVLSARWLSNPTPMFLISMLLIYSLFLIINGRRWAWVAVAFLLGMSMQFGSAAEVFFFPAVFAFGVWQRGNRPSWKIASLSLFVLIVTFIPQIWFDLKHEGVLSNAIKKFLIGDQSFKVSFWEVLKIRSKFYFDLYASKLFPVSPEYRKWFLGIFLAGLIWGIKPLFSNKYSLTALIIFIAPMIGMAFFQGNHGNVYDYYFTGYYFIFVLLFSVVLATLARHFFGKVLIVFFLVLFLRDNIPITKNYINDGGEGENTISFVNQKKSLDWVYADLGSCKNFSTDEYVPPVIPYAYEYLFTWYGGRVHHCPPVAQQVDLLYTLYEVDPPHPERLETWLDRQKGIGTVEKQARFGGITIQRRHRIPGVS